MHPITTPTQLGAILTGRRKQLDLTQSTVAKRLGVGQNRLSQLEAKPETMTVEQLLALLNMLGLEMRVVERTAPGKSKVEW
ncbi:MAG: helix-turn-helix domain-containing protein [Pseudomonadota bacterium]